MSYVTDICIKADALRQELGLMSTSQKNKALIDIACQLRANASQIISQNAIDVENGRNKGMHEGLIDRLMLNDKRIEAMALGIEQVASLPDPSGCVLDEFTRPNGLLIKKVSVPIGVIGIIYESRPNVTPDAFSLCFKSGNVVILKGGSDAINSNSAITRVIRDTLERDGISPDVVQLVETTDRAAVDELLRMNDYIDLLIPRGSAGLIRNVINNSSIPVIQTGTGNCHIFVDSSADIDKAIKIIINSKTQRIGVCNAAESLVVDRSIANTFLPVLAVKLREHNVEIRGDEETQQIIKDCVPATEEDFGKEYLDYIISVKIVNGVDEAIRHINKYNTGHSESIITQDKINADKFLAGIDAACVYVNASTRFTDGFEFGFGAEIGISTQKIHARGPMGLKELTSYKYEIIGNGQIRE